MHTTHCLSQRSHHHYYDNGKNIINIWIISYQLSVNMIYIWRRFINLFEFFYLFVFLFVLLPVKHKQFNCQKQQGQLMSSFQYVTEIPQTGDITITFDFFWQKTQMLRLFTRLSEEVMLKMEPTVSYRSSGLRAALNQGPLALPSSHSAWMTGDMNV